MTDTRVGMEERRREQQLNAKLAHYVTEICGQRMQGFENEIKDMKNQLGSLNHNTNLNSDSVESLRTEIKTISEKAESIEKSIADIVEIFTSIKGSFKLINWAGRFIIWAGMLAAAIGGIFWAGKR